MKGRAEMIDRNVNELLNKFLSTKKFIIKDENLVENSLDHKKMVIIEIMCNLILSKKIFKRNIVIGEFLSTFFKINLSKSTLCSRTLVSGRLIRIMNDVNTHDELDNFLNILNNILNKIIKEEDIFSQDIYDVINNMEI